MAVTIINGMKYSEGWSLLNSVMGFVSIRMFHWTYAPLQFVFTSLLLNPSMSFEALLFWGRLPSVMFGVLSIVFMGKTVEVLYSDEKSSEYIKLLMMCLLAFNSECILYSAQMETYEIGVLCVLLIIIYVYRKVDGAIDYKTSIVMALFCYAQYQMFIFVFAFYLLFGMVALVNRDREQVCKIIKSGALMVMIDVPCFAYFFMGHMYKRGVAWNVGIENKYLFSMDKLNLKYFAEFFIGNYYDYIKYLIIPGKIDGWSIPLILITMILSVIGIISLLLKKNKKKYIGLYLGIVLLIYFFLIFAGALTFSPSRHMLIMVPVTLVLLTQGIYFCYEKIVQPFAKIFSGVLFVYVVVFLLLFMLEIPEQIDIRRNRVTKEQICSLMDKYDVIVAHGYSMEPYIFLKDVCDIYNEKAKKIDLEHLDRICKVLDCSVDEILEFEDDGN